MQLELDTTLLKKIGNINLNQLVFLSLLLDKNQKTNQGIATIVSQVSDNEIEDLVNRDLVERVANENQIEYKETDKLLILAKPNRDYFEEFNTIFPKVVTRPDGTTSFLKQNIKRCKDQYKKIIGRNEDMHEHIMDCLNYELADKAATGKLGFMKTMWKWLTTCEWENSEELMKDTPILNIPTYGTNLI